MDKVVKTFRELSAAQQPEAGGKGSALAWLFQANYPVPDGFVILPPAFSGDTLTGDAWEQIKAQLTHLREEANAAAFAVRSSAMAEDSAQASFAGEFETVLKVRTDAAILEAIQTVRRSRHSERVQVYSQSRDLHAAHELAVIVQIFVPAQSSGVLFTAHPVTGNRDQAMISAAWGLGEAIVGGLVTPDTLVVDKTTGRVLSRETADKQVMTVTLESGTDAQPVPEAQRRAAVLSDAEAAELVALGTQIEALYGHPMDIEWVLTKGTFSIVQARPITALPAPEPPVPTNWDLPKGSYAAVRNNIVELMIEPLSPLFRTLGLAAVNTSMKRLLADFFGEQDLMPDDLIITIHTYAYYNGSWSAGQLARILLNTVGITKRMLTGAVARWTEDAHPHYRAVVADWQAQPWQRASSTALLEMARTLTETAIDAYGALVSGIIPAAWISEGLFTAVYNVFIKRRDDPPAPVYLMGFDSLPILAEKALYDLAAWTRPHAALAAHVSNTPAAELAAQLEAAHTAPGIAPDLWRDWQHRVRAHLQRYGHTIYNLDFANPVPADDPAPLLETYKLFLRGEGVDPHARQQAAAARREQAIETIQQRLKGLRLKLFHKVLAPAQRYAPLREDGLAEVGLSYPLLRRVFRELGRRLVANGMLADPDDIFWLEEAEVAQAASQLDQGKSPEPLGERIPQRKSTWRSARRATPPPSLFKILGVTLGKAKQARLDRQSAQIKGVAASPGRVTAPARVLHGPEDFAQMQTGEILVAALTTPAWTPLFARAAAVVTDIGGPLSHGSIVAREYGIPAVLGTGIATKRIRSGQIVTVDGSAGTVTLGSEETPPA